MRTVIIGDKRNCKLFVQDFKCEGSDNGLKLSSDPKNEDKKEPGWSEWWNEDNADGFDRDINLHDEEVQLIVFSRAF